MDGTLSPLSLSALGSRLGADGFALVRAPETRALLGPQALAGWEAFAASWDTLGLDTYMADGGRYRRRRYAVFEAGEAGTLRKPHQPHYQSRDYNTLNGGLERWFEPVTPEVAANPALAAFLATGTKLFTALTPAERRPRAWHVEMHQFRIEARPGIVGKPAPEGMHQDGVDWVLIVMVRRENVASGETSIESAGHQPLGSFTLTDPLDAALADDNRVYHGVTPITLLDPARPAWRDVLVLTWRHQ